LRIEEFRGRNCHRHVSVNEGFCACQGSGDPFHGVVGSLMVVNCSNVPDEESQQRVALGCDDETVSEDAVGFVFCVGFIAHEKACVLA
jgi:hypothetical protein